MLLLSVKRGSPVPVYKQIHDQIIKLVDDGTLEPGTRLPPTRVLAQKIGANRSTVYRAYQELWALGYMESRPGSYSTVRRRARMIPANGRADGQLIDWRAASPAAARRIYDDYVDLCNKHPRNDSPHVIRFTQLSADRELCPVDDLRLSVKRVLIQKGKDILDYGDPAGYGPLRETIARRMRIHGVTVSADQILVTNGAQHAIDLVLRLLCQQGSSVAVEVPTYSLAIPLFRFHGVSMMEVPMREDGMDLDVLQKRLNRLRPALLYTIPNFHNPTGITTGQAHREKLLSLCEAHRIPVVEDGFEEEMKYFGKAVLPIKSMDVNGIVIYLGTFSKVIFPGLRVGWIAADRDCIQRLLAIYRYSNLSGNNLAQVAIDHFCNAGHYEEHIRRIHRAYRKRMQAMLRAMEEHMPQERVEWTRPAGGYTLWVRLRDCRRSEKEAQQDLLKAGVAISPGSFYFPAPQEDVYFRLSVTNLTEEQIEEGVRRLGKSLRRILAGG
ncbi:MAG: PLP-dependent aminotransferase family protein [Acidobacteriota bacterium]